MRRLAQGRLASAGAESRRSRGWVGESIYHRVHREHGGDTGTDQASAYDRLPAQQYIHETVNHVREYVRGEVHTQGIENFWSLLKRGLKGTYVAVEPFHLDRYVTEQVFRFNTGPPRTIRWTILTGSLSS